MPYILFLALALLGMTNSVFAKEPSSKIHYVGFNDFLDTNDNAEQVFKKYTEAITPIMERHGLTLITYKVTHSLSDHISADAITFGTAPDQERFAAFFADPDFQAAFPDLVGIIDEHVIVFTDGHFMPSEVTPERDTLLQLYWFASDAATGVNAFRESEAGLANLKSRYGVTDDAESHGVMVNRGLAGEITSEEPPHLMTIGGYRHAHAYLEHPTVEMARKEIEEKLEKSSAFWIKPWD